MKLTVAFLLLFCVELSQAQRGGVGFGHAGPGFGVGGFGHRGGERNGAFFGGSFWPDEYPSGSLVSLITSAPMQQVVPRSFEPERLSEPLLIEWHGDRYVRISDKSSNSDLPDYAESTTPRSLPDPSAATRTEIPPAVLVFRDGHREQISDYVITRGVLYTDSDYALTGLNTRTIRLAALDIPATLKANQESGSKFALPHSANEVVTRP